MGLFLGKSPYGPLRRKRGGCSKVLSPLPPHPASTEHAVTAARANAPILLFIIIMVSSPFRLHFLLFTAVLCLYISK